MEWKNGRYLISDDASALNLDEIHEMLKKTYWASERTAAQLEKAMRHSLSVGMFDDATQIGFARAVTDYATFSWICDVVVREDYRKKGLGKWMLQCLFAHPDISSTRMILVTRDAQQLYSKYGFVDHPYGCMMKKDF